MSERDKTESSSSSSSCGGGVPWFPLRKWWQSSMLFNQDVGLPPFLEPAGDPGWMHVDRLQGGLAGCSWPRYVPAPLFVPYISGPVRPPGQQTSEEQYKWRVSLEVAHFAPSEISLSVRDGFLEVGGKHEERPDEHGFIARCFTRKYRLPAEIHATTVVSTLSVDGILTVEAPVSRTFVPSAVIIPIHVELEVTGEEELDNCRAPEARCLPSAEDDGEESQHEVQGHRGEPEEGGHEEPAGESRPSAPEDGTAGHRDSAEHPEPAVDGETRVLTGSGEDAEETPHPEEPGPGESAPSEGPSPELEAAAVKQERTE